VRRLKRAPTDLENEEILCFDENVEALKLFVVLLMSDSLAVESVL
jgi:hypothetical protein